MEKLDTPFYTQFLVGALIADELSYVNALKGTIFDKQDNVREICHHEMPSPVADKAITMVSVKGEPQFAILSEWLGNGVVTIEYIEGRDQRTTTYTADGIAKTLMDLRIHLGLRTVDQLREPLEDPVEPSRAE